MSRIQWLSVILLVGWLGATAAGYWWYQARHLGPYQGSPEQLGRIDPERVKQRFEQALAERAVAGRPTLVHFSQSSCRCDRSSREHLKDLQRQFADLQLVQVARPDEVPEPLARAEVIRAAELWALVPAVPSAAVIDGEGQLRYFGPYSSGPTCGSGINFVDQTLQQLHNGAPELWVNDMAFGCFCASGTYRR